MNRTILTPIFVLSGIAGTIALMAGTDIFNPLIKFIHSETLTPIEAGVYLLFTVAGFAASYFLLNTLCSYFVPRINIIEKNHNNSLKEQQKHAYLCAKNSNNNF